MPGALSRIIGSPPGQLATTNSLSSAQTSVLRHSTTNVPTPSQPGKMGSLRVSEIQNDPRFFTKEEADQLGSKAKEWKDAAKNTKKAYEHLLTIDNAEMEAEEHHYEYLGGVAKNEAKRMRTKSQFVKKLHNLRVAYASIDESISQAARESDDRINKKRAEIRGRVLGQGNRKKPQLLSAGG